jgi:hypothetical protein
MSKILYLNAKYQERRMIECGITHDARVAKAEKIVRVLLDANATPNRVRGMDDAGWTAAEKLAGVRTCSDDTRELVANLLEFELENTQ